MEGIRRFDHVSYGMVSDSTGEYVTYYECEKVVASVASRAMEQIDSIKAAHEAEIARLRAEVEACRKDAERYRWLRDTPWFDNYEIRSVISHQQNAVWDETIDAAMGASA